MPFLTFPSYLKRHFDIHVYLAFLSVYIYLLFLSVYIYLLFLSVYIYLLFLSVCMYFPVYGCFRHRHRHAWRTLFTYCDLFLAFFNSTYVANRKIIHFDDIIYCLHAMTATFQKGRFPKRP